MSYLLHLFVLVEIYIILSVSLNLIIGYTGLLTLAHAAINGIGAYVSTLLMVDLKLNFFLAMVFAIIAAMVLSLLISFASLKLRGDYFVLATLAFQVIVFTILYNWVGVTRGSYGITNIPTPSMAGFKIGSLASFAVMGFILAFVICSFLALIFRSPFGRTLQAIRDDEIAATALGKNVASFKVRSIAIASGCAAVAGSLYATYITYIDPTSFTTEESILLLSMVIVGGTGNIKGPIIGAALLILIPESLRLLAIPSSAAPNIRIIIYGALLILMMRFRPQGIAGKYRLE